VGEFKSDALCKAAVAWMKANESGDESRIQATCMALFAAIDRFRGTGSCLRCDGSGEIRYEHTTVECVSCNPYGRPAHD
jgi:hypothetical protein